VRDGRAHDTEPMRYAQYCACYYTALRRGDLGRLTWDCIDFEHSTMEIRDGKGGRIDVIPITDQLERALRELLPPMTMPGALHGQRVFPRVVTMAELRADQRRGRAVWIRQAMTRKVRRDRRASAFLVSREGAELDLHSLRHTRATDLALTEAPPAMVQA